MNAFVDYSGAFEIDTSISSKWLKQYTESGYIVANTRVNAKATAYLLDTNVWANFKDSNGYAEYAVGGPTLELFRDSYNVTHETDIETQVNNATGYQLRWKTEDNSNSYVHYVSGLSTSESLYVINSYANAAGMWLASPCVSDEYCVMYVEAEGTVANVYDDSGYVRYPPDSFSKI